MRLIGEATKERPDDGTTDSTASPYSDGIGEMLGREHLSEQVSTDGSGERVPAHHP